MRAEFKQRMRERILVGARRYLSSYSISVTTTAIDGHAYETIPHEILCCIGTSAGRCPSFRNTTPSAGSPSSSLRNSSFLVGMSPLSLYVPLFLL